MPIYFRHDQLRLPQKSLIDDMYEALSKGQNFMAQAPTGLGKCISGDSLLFTSNGLVAIKDFVYGKTNSLSSNNIFLREGELIKIGKEKILKISIFVTLLLGCKTFYFSFYEAV